MKTEYILLAKLKNKHFKVTIDSETNINCIDPDLVYLD